MLSFETNILWELPLVRESFLKRHITTIRIRPVPICQKVPKLISRPSRRRPTLSLVPTRPADTRAQLSQSILRPEKHPICRYLILSCHQRNILRDIGMDGRLVIYELASCHGCKTHLSMEPSFRSITNLLSSAFESPSNHTYPSVL
jgi:hypothetical protein